MTATRRTQPYRQGPREPSSALSAMLRGGPFQLPNPQDQERQRMAVLARLIRGWK